jgi:hypothetical protein
VPSRILRATVFLTAAVLGGCGESPTTPAKTQVAQAPRDLRAEGDAAAQRGDWETAANRYREALQTAPNDLVLHFALGSAFSQLNRLTDAIEEFSWVVQHGEPSRSEVAMARQWLQQATASRSSSEPRAASADPTREAPANPVPLTADASVGLIEGRTEWPGLGPHEKRRLSVHLRLRGDSEATAPINKRLNMEIGMPFELGRVPPGRYRLVGESKGVTLWDVPLAVEKDKTTNVELSPANSTVRPADFPPAG